MILSPEEKAANRAAFRAMGLGQKLEYVLAYYKLPLVLALVAAVALGSLAYRALTHKEPVLYLAYANVVPDEAANELLTVGFVEDQALSPRRSEVVCYHELYLSDDASQQNHQYAYASKLKVMAAVDAEQLDVALMNREAYDQLSASGYLLDLTEAVSSDSALAARLQHNTVVLSDNRVEVELGEAAEYEAQTLEAANALEVSDLPVFANLQEGEQIYVGLVANTPRRDAALGYLSYLVSCG